ncbi:MAG: triphosphoribosyl-dephospho-CoA synthase [Deltaproteobacteria bacterium]|nr:triphosphoribosyl-dephospho-CoA synthase [Deltaproteobacteria bacterium]
MTSLETDQIVWAAQLASTFEACADKPGNVTRSQSFSTSRFEDFLVSAFAIGPAVKLMSRSGVGETVLNAVRATRMLTGTNTNLGILLLVVPLAKAVSRNHPGGIRKGLSVVLNGLTAADTCNIYEAIRHAEPAGLGKVAAYDVRETELNITLKEAMAHARKRDSIAAEYVTDFDITFTLGYPTLNGLWKDGHRFSECVVHTFLRILSEIPDTLISRKNGPATTRRICEIAKQVCELGQIGSDKSIKAIEDLDAQLRGKDHKLNPGTTADLTAAAIFIFLTEGGMLAHLPELLRRW